jgi:DNA-binding transcriptional ArsR family regulator
VKKLKTKEPSCRRDPRVIELAEALKILSDPNRLRMMCYLLAGEKCVCDVERELGISQQLTSHHLSVLKEAGFLVMRKEGTSSHFSVDREYLKRVNEMFEQFLSFRKVIC